MFCFNVLLGGFCCTIVLCVLICGFWVGVLEFIWRVLFVYRFVLLGLLLVFVVCRFTLFCCDWFVVCAGVWWGFVLFVDLLLVLIVNVVLDWSALDLFVGFWLVLLLLLCWLRVSVCFCLIFDCLYVSRLFVCCLLLFWIWCCWLLVLVSVFGWVCSWIDCSIQVWCLLGCLLLLCWLVLFVVLFVYFVDYIVGRLWFCGVSYPCWLLLGVWCVTCYLLYLRFSLLFTFLVLCGLFCCLTCVWFDSVFAIVGGLSWFTFVFAGLEVEVFVLLLLYTCSWLRLRLV